MTERCPICQEGELTKIELAPELKEKVEIMRCNKCSYERQIWKGDEFGLLITEMNNKFQYSKPTFYGRAKEA